MDVTESRKRPAQSPLDTMSQSEADIEAGRVQDFDAYLARITRQVDDAIEAKRRREAARA